MKKKVIKIKLVPKKNGKGYVTTYQMCFGSREAKNLNLLDKDGNVKKIKEAKKVGDNSIEVEFE